MAIAACAAAPQEAVVSTSPVPIVRQAADGPNPDGSYSWAYETGDGIKAEEQGQLRNAGSETEAEAVQGAFSYTAPDGTPIEVTYIADENGFQPQGAHLPVAPAIPEAIQRALEYIAAHPEENNIDENKSKSDWVVGKRGEERKGVLY